MAGSGGEREEQQEARQDPGVFAAVRSNETYGNKAAKTEMKP